MSLINNLIARAKNAAQNTAKAIKAWEVRENDGQNIATDAEMIEALIEDKYAMRNVINAQENEIRQLKMALRTLNG